MRWAWIPPASRSIQMEWALWKKWATVHRENTRRMEYQTSYGRRIWSGWGSVCIVCRTLRRRSGRPCSLAAARSGGPSGSSADGPGLWRWRNESPGFGAWVYACRSTEEEPKKSLELWWAVVQTTKSGRELV